MTRKKREYVPLPAAWELACLKCKAFRIRDYRAQPSYKVMMAAVSQMLEHMKGCKRTEVVVPIVT